MLPSPASWHLTFWPWKWCTSLIWRGIPMCQPVSEMTYTVSSGTLNLNPTIPYHTCANFSLPRPLCSRLRPDVRDRDVLRYHRLMLPTLARAGCNKYGKTAVYTHITFDTKNFILKQQNHDRWSAMLTRPTITRQRPRPRRTPRPSVRDWNQGRSRPYRLRQGRVHITQH